MNAVVPRLLSHPLFSIVAFEIFSSRPFCHPQPPTQDQSRLMSSLCDSSSELSIYAAPLAGDSNFARLWIFAWVLWLATFTKFVGTAVPPE